MAVIDSRIVEMKFNNQDFETNAKTSLATLDKLKQALNFGNKTGLEKLGTASNSLDLSGISSSVDAIANRFSTLGVIGMTALSRLTNFAIDAGKKIANGLMGPITSGGFNRAMNLENAKFQLEGLKVAWEEILPDIEHGVNETAYGLDAAAKVAAQLSASGIQTGDAMKNALRGISGVAAMTNSSYEEIGHIFTTVAGNGRMFATELNSIGARGLNAAAALADFFNKVNEGSEDIQHVPEDVQKMVKSISNGAKVGEGEIRDFVSKGKINFEIFSNAMDSAFGEQAKKANETFTGALSNMKSALGRIGAKFATPYLNNMRDIFNSLRVLFNGVNKMIDPIVGTYEKVFGGVTKYLTGLIDSGQALETIQNVITAIRNSFWNLMMVLMPIKDAFVSIFPPKTRDDAVSISAALVKFSESLAISGEGANRVYVIFRSFFLVLSLVGEVLKNLIYALSPVGLMFIHIGNSLARLFAHFAQMIGIAAGVKKSGDSISNAFQKISRILWPITVNISASIDMLVNKIIKFSNTHFKFPSFDIFKKNAEDVEKSSSILSRAFDIVKGVFSGLASIFKASLPIFEAIGKSLGSALTGFANGLSAAFGESGLKGVLDFINSGLLVGAGFAINTFVERLLSASSNITLLPGAIKSLLWEFNNQIKVMQQVAKADVIMKIAKAVALLAASLFVLSTIDGKALAISLAAVSALFMQVSVALGYFMKSMTGLKVVEVFKNKAMFESASGLLIAMGIGLLAIAGAIKVLSGLKTEEVLMGLSAVGILLYSLSRFITTLNGQALEVGAVKMIGLALSIKILSSVVKSLGQLDLASLAKGIGGLGVLLFALSKYMNSLKSPINPGQALGMVLMASSLVIFGKAIAQIGALPFGQIIQGVTGLGLSLVAFGAFFNMVDTKGAFAKGTALLAASVGMKLIASALIALSDIPFGQLMTGLVGIAAPLILMAVALSAMSKNSVGSAAAILVASAALLLLTPALISLSKVPFLSLIGAIAGIAAALAVFGVAAALLQPVIIPMIALAGAVTLLGVGVAAAGAGVTLFAAGLTALVGAGAAGITMLVGVINTLIGAIPLFLTTLANGIIGFITTLGQGAPQMIEGIVNILSSLLQGIITLAPEFATAGVTLLSSFIGACIAIVPQIVTLGMTIITSLLSGIAQNMQGITESTIQIITGFINGIASQLGSIIQAGFNLMISFINGLADGVRNNTEAMMMAGLNLVIAMIESMAGCILYFADIGMSFMSSLLTGIVSFVQNILTALVNLGADMLKSLGFPEDWANVAKDFVNGFITGIGEKIKDAINAAKNLGQMVLEGLRGKDSLDSHSDSRETIITGHDTASGLATGIDEWSYLPVAAAENMGVQVKDTIASTLADAAKSADTFKTRYNKALKSTTTSVKEQRKEQMDLRKAMRESKNETLEASKANDALAASGDRAAEGVGKTGRAAKSAAKDVKDLSETIYESIEGSMSDPFAKMELKAEISKQDLLKNMESQLTAVASWSAKLSELGEKGVSEGLLKYLADLGPQGYQYVHAFSTMTLEEVAKANQLYTAQLAMPASATAQIKGSFEQAGIDVGDGFLKAMKEKGIEWAAEGEKAGEGTIEGINTGLGVQSPSWKTRESGINIIQGLIQGLDKMTPSLKTKIWEICTAVIERFREMLAKNKFVEIGIDVIKGIIDGMESTDVLTSVEKVADNIYTTIKNELAKSKFESIGKDIGQGLIDGMKSMEDAVLKAGSGIGKIALKGTKSGAQTESPSKFTTKVGKYIGDGLIVGMRARESAVEAAAENLSRSPLDILKDTINGIYSGLGRDDFNPVITPILDLSDVKDKASTLQKLLSDREIAINRLKFSASGVGTDLNAQNGYGNTVNFTQNNYSPKALSTYDIYRQTRNQLSTVKGAIGLS